jgi:hypothetical protein
MAMTLRSFQRAVRGLPANGRTEWHSLTARAQAFGRRLRQALGAVALLAFVALAAVALLREARVLRAAEQARWAEAPTGLASAVTSDAGSDRAVQEGRAAPPPPRPEEGMATGASEPGLIVLLRLGRRQVHQAAFTLALEQPGKPLVPLIGHSAPDGRAGPLRLPPGLRGRFDITLRVPGFLPARALGVTVGEGIAVIDFAAGGVAPLRAGDLDGDERIDATDALLWLRHRGRPSWRMQVDTDGDGEVGLSDLRLLWANRSTEPPVAHLP